MQFQDHDGDDDGQYAVAEGFKPVLVHPNIMRPSPRIRASPNGGRSRAAVHRDLPAAVGGRGPG
jgi:hypothetical protein